MEIPTFPTLYKSQGGTRALLEWKVRVEPLSDGSGAAVEVLTGVAGTDRPIVSREVIREGKNIGKANETSPLQQAVLRATSRYNKQLDKFYRETMLEAEEAFEMSTNPMLANKFEDKHHTLKDGESVILQPKLDGMRCLAVKDNGVVSLFSRGGKAISSVPHIKDQLCSAMEDGDTWDGEIYTHGMAFEKIMSLARKAKPDKDHESLSFHVFDVVDSLSFLERNTRSFRVLEDLCLPSIVRVSHQAVKYGGEISVVDYVRHCELEGYEGAILRRESSPYEHKRTSNLLKIKNFFEEDFRIIGCEDGKEGSRKEAILQSFVLGTIGTNGQHSDFRASLYGTEEELRGMWAIRDTFIGRKATVVFQEKTAYGIPRFPKVKCVRED